MDSFSLQMEEDAIYAILDYIEDNLSEPDKKMPVEEFTKRSAKRWAAFEIIGRMEEFPYENPLMIVLSFYKEMEKYAEFRPERRLIFESAKELAMKIFEILYEL